MKNCNECALEYDDSVAYCGKCGSKLEKIEAFEGKRELILPPPQYQKTSTPNSGCGCGCTVVIVIVIIFIIVGGCNLITSNSSKPKKFEDYTNKEMGQFLQWRDKEQQNRKDNERFFK